MSSNHNSFLVLVKKLGEISFSVYLTHLPVLFFIYSIINKISGETAFYRRFYLLRALVAVAFNVLFYLVIEAPSKKWIRVIKSKARDKVTTNKPRTGVL